MLLIPFLETVKESSFIDRLFFFNTFLIILFVISLVYVFRHSPFKYPYKTITFDISGKRTVDFLDLLDTDLITHGIQEYQNQMIILDNWKQQCQEEIERSPFKEKRTQQYQRCLDDNRIFRFVLIRKQKRYQQVNHMKIDYTTDQICDSFSVSYAFILDRYKQLNAIHFQSTLSEYHSLNQRKLMTKELRTKIAKRDHYTCKMCGKYMPDGVGLEIDHIIPINKGGKTNESNLQVLCSKCNRSKSDKIL